MAVYVDPCRWPFHGELWCHLMTDGDSEELRAFARRIGLEHARIQREGTPYEHYDLPPAYRELAVWAGAIEVGSKEMIRYCVRIRSRRQIG